MNIDVTPNLQVQKQIKVNSMCKNKLYKYLRNV